MQIFKIKEFPGKAWDSKPNFLKHKGFTILVAIHQRGCISRQAAVNAYALGHITIGPKSRSSATNGEA